MAAITPRSTSATTPLSSYELQLDSVVVARADLVFMPFGELTVVVAERAVTLNESSLILLASLDGSRSLEEAAAFVASAHHLRFADLRDVMISVAVGFAQADLLEGVTYVEAPVAGSIIAAATGEDDVQGDADRPDGPPPARRGIPDPGSCVGQRLHTGDAEFIDVEGASGGVAISCNDAAVAASLREHFAAALGDPSRYGLAVVVGPYGPSRGPLLEIFDGTGYRIWRGRTLNDLCSAVAALLVPLVFDPEIKRGLFHYRRLERDGRAVLVHPPLIEDMLLQRAIERRGWSIPPSVFSEIDLDTGEVVVRGAFDPASPARSPVIGRLPIDGFGMQLQLEAGRGLAPVVAGLCNAHLPSKFTASLRESIPVIRRLAANSIARWPLMPGTDQQLPFVTRLLADVERAAVERAEIETSAGRAS